MRLGDTRNEAARPYGRPLDGVRVLAIEQLQAMPYATQLLARLGADVVKIEKPGTGDSGRLSLPAIPDPQGRPLGATFLRNNLNKRSVALDIATPEGRDLVLRLAPRFDVVAENFRPGVLERLGLGWDDVHAVAPRAVYLSISGFGHGPSPYRELPAYAPVPEAMSGIYEMKREPGRPPVPVPLGGVGDTGSALYAVIGVLAALLHRDATGRGERVDIAMYDCMLALTDIVTNFWSMGLDEGRLGPQIMHGFRAEDGWLIVICLREWEFTRLAECIGHPEWLTDERLATRAGWVAELESLIRPGIEGWAAGRTRAEACEALGAAGVAAAPCLRADEVAHDPHAAAHDMLVELEHDGPRPVLVSGNPVRMSDVAVGPETRVPWLGEHSDTVLQAELGLVAAELDDLRARGVLG